MSSIPSPDLSAPMTAISVSEGLTTRDPEIAIFRPTKSNTYRAKTTGLKSPRRRRTEREAIALLDSTKRLSGLARRHAVMRVRAAAQPVTEARRILARIARDAVAGYVEYDETGFANVQELLAEIIRRDGILDQPQAMLLARMDRQIVTAGMNEDEFSRFAAALFGEAMKPALPERVRRGGSPLAVMDGGR